MFGLGTWEIALILVAALIFIGPGKLPELARSLGKGMREMRRAMAGLEREISDATSIPEDDEKKRSPKEGGDAGGDDGAPGAKADDGTRVDETGDGAPGDESDDGRVATTPPHGRRPAEEAPSEQDTDEKTGPA
ncbi:MAG: Sec-independent protein translocase subunit TatA/TatB [Myxococcota bacterium]